MSGLNMEYIIIAIWILAGGYCILRDKAINYPYDKLPLSNILFGFAFGCISLIGESILFIFKRPWRG
jgi:hypothetical protein